MLLDQSLITNWLTDLFSAANVPAEEARLIAIHLVDADASGHPSHGIVRVPRYFEYLEQNMVSPKCDFATIMESGPLLLIDGKFSFGQVLGHHMIAESTRLIDEHGIALIGLRQSGHLGRIGAWAELLADKHYISLHFVNVAGSAIVAPFGAKEARLSTAPIAIGVPHFNDDGSSDHFIHDFATSLVAEGKILVSQKTGSTLPANAMVDETGSDSAIPTTIYGATADDDVPNPTAGTGAIQTFGDHKGSGLGIACELLAGALTGTGTNATKRPFCNGMLSVIFDPNQFDTNSALTAEIADYIAAIRNAGPRSKDGSVFIPGDKERQRRAKIAQDGVPLDEVIINQLIALSDKWGVKHPLR